MVLEAEINGEKTAKPYFFLLRGDSKERSWLYAAAVAMSKVKEGNDVVIRGNSAYLDLGFKHLTEWQDRGWRRFNGMKVKNADLWSRIFEMQKTRKALFLSVKEHSYSAWMEWEAEKRAKMP